MKFTALRTLPHGVEEIHAVLTDLAAAPEWIPALTSVAPLREGHPEDGYELRIREQLPAQFSFDTVTPLRVDYSVVVAEMSERGSFRLTPAADGTIVDHRFSHAGALLILMRGALETTADARLNRLEQRVEELRLQHDRTGLGGTGTRERGLS